MSYDIVCGLDNPTLNQVVTQFYQALYPTYLKDTLTVEGISVGFDINQPPLVQLNNSDTARAHFQQALANDSYGPTSQLPAEHQATLLQSALGASFGFILPSVAFTLQLGSQPVQTVTVQITGAASIQTSSQNGTNYLSVTLFGAQATPTSDFQIWMFINQVVMPIFLAYLNDNILANICVPALQYGKLQVSMPVPLVQNFPDSPPMLVVYSSLGQVPPMPAPLLLNGPQNCVFIGMDSAVLQAAAALPFPLGPSTGFSWDIVSGQVGAQVLPPNPVSVNADGTISATIEAQAVCQLTLHTPNGLPNVSFGPSATATLSATLKPTVIDGELFVSIEGVPIPTFNFNWGIPDWINWLFSPIENGLAAALNDILGPLIGHALQFPPIPVLQLPQLSFTLSGKTIDIDIEQVTTSTQDSMLLMSSQLHVS